VALRRPIWLTLSIFLSAGCEDRSDETDAFDQVGANAFEQAQPAQHAAFNPLRNVYFGDTHVHTALSFDAYLMGTRRSPDDAYEFAKGKAIEHARGFPMQMKKPLDFLAVSDHAVYLGMMRAIADAEGPYAEHPLHAVLKGATSSEGSRAAFQSVAGYILGDAEKRASLENSKIMRSAWQEIIEAAERHNEPGRFTAFIANEYTATGPEMENLHRNVLFSGASVPTEPFSRSMSSNPEDLWSWMDQKRSQGFDSLAIPHNSNGSDGWMFPDKNWAGSQLDAAWADQRMRNEPIVENSQVKGTSDTHPLLSPNDEWADFELMNLKVATQQPSRPQGSYVREASLNGLKMEAEQGFNPYKFGVIAASDSHNGAGSFEEDNYWSKVGFADTPAYRRGSVPLPAPAEDGSIYANGNSTTWGASGLAGVWAESNTRQALFNAMRRKKTFSTSGPRIKVRFFAGADFDKNMIDADNSVEQAYAGGVPMGADLGLGPGEVPSFYIWAARDPDTQPLQRLHIVKGWIENGETKESVIDVACSDGLRVDVDTGRCPDNGAGVDLSTCTATGNAGDRELKAVWRDPEFDGRALYYVRVLENPSCRWSTYDAIRAGVAPRPDMHSTLQERAWSSPIWVSER
jgi:hypothetical protein